MEEPQIPLRIDVTEDELVCLIDALETAAKNTAALASCRSILLKITDSLQKEEALQNDPLSQIAR